METSAAKRRKISPEEAVPVNENESTTPQDPPPERPVRASYASPTKSSLSRHNPDILLRRQASPTKLAADLGGSEDAGTSQPEPGSLTPLLEKQLRDDGRAGVLQKTQNGDGIQEKLFQNRPKRLSQSPRRSLGGSLAARPRRSNVKSNPRPFPPPGPREEEEVLNPFFGRSLRRSPPAGIPRLEPEPELPPTPERPDVESSTPPTGIHNTPSRRPRRSRALAEKLSSSPKKWSPAKTSLEAQEPDRYSPNVADPLPLPQDEQPLGGDAGPPKPSSIRGVERSDAVYEKKRQREALLAEIKQLELDLDVAARENERIRRSHAARKDAPAPSNSDEILEVLRRHALPPNKPAASDNNQVANWVQAALNPIAFLPFGKPSSTLPALFPDTPVPEEKEIVSHHPIPMSTEEALPFLQVFSPLAFTSTISILPTEEGDDADQPLPLQQRHSIAVSSSAAPGLFAARIEMTVDTSSHTITDLAVPRLDPTAAAELGPFIKKIVEQDAANSALSRNVSILAWSMGEWLRVAIRRAKTWRTLQRELGSKEGMAETVRRMRTRGKKKSRRNSKNGRDGGAAESDDDEEDADEGGDVADIVGSLVGSLDLLPYMGQRSMDFRVPAGSETKAEVSTLKIQWRIEFDWTGEARSRIEALVALPSKCESHGPLECQ